MFWNRKAPALIDESGLTEQQKILAAMARKADTAALWDGAMPTNQMKMKQEWDAQDRAEAGRDALALAQGVQLDPMRMDRLSRYGLDVVPSGQTSPSPLNVNQMAIGSMAEAGQQPTAQDLLNPGGDLTPLNAAQQVLASGYKSPAYLRYLASQGYDVSSIAPKWEGQDIYTEDGRKQRAYVDATEPTRVTNVGGAAAPDVPNRQAIEIGRNGGKVKGVFNPATGQIEGTLGDVMYPSAAESGNETPSSIREVETVARWQAQAAQGDDTAKRNLDAYSRFMSGKNDPEDRARNYAKMIQEETKALRENYEDKADDGTAWANKPYEERRAEAKRRVDEIVGMGREMGGGAQTRPADPRKPPEGYPDARWSDKAGGWVVQRNGRWNLVGGQ